MQTQVIPLALFCHFTFLNSIDLLTFIAFAICSTASSGYCMFLYITAFNDLKFYI